MRGCFARKGIEFAVRILTRKPLCVLIYLCMSCSFCFGWIAQVQGEGIQERLAFLQESSQDMHYQIKLLRQQLSAARKKLSGLVVQKGRLESQEKALQDELASVELHLDEIEYDIEHLEGLAASYQHRKYQRLQVLDEFEVSDELARAVGRSAEEIDYDDFFLLAGRMQQEENVLVVRSRESLQQLRRAQKTERGLFEKQKILHVNLQREQRELSEILQRKRIQEQALREKERELRQKAIGLQAELLRVESVLASLSSETSQQRERLRDSSKADITVQDRRSLRAQFRSDALSAPVLGTVAQRFRKSRPGDPYRNGILFQVDESAQKKGVAAIADGIVTFRGRLPFFGESLIVEHGPDEFSLYGHVSRQTAELSQRIRQGEKIAELESDGRLYLELRKQGKSVDPQPLFRSEHKRG